MPCFSRPEDEDEVWRREANKRIDRQLEKDKRQYKATHRLLLLGLYVVLITFSVVIPGELDDRQSCR